jgi:hypothetical protein
LQRRGAKRKKQYATGVDKGWGKAEKRGNYHFGSKKHHVTDNKGLVIGVLTTTVSKNKITNLEDVLKTVNIDLPKGIPLKVGERETIYHYIMNLTWYSMLEKEVQYVANAESVPLNLTSKHLFKFPKKEFMAHCEGGYRILITASIFLSK